VGHLESAKEPGHFVGKGSLKLTFDRIGLPSGDLPLEAKMIGTPGYHVDREGKIIGKGHATRDVVEWMLPPLWPWKVITLPAKGPRPKLKGETTLELRLMDDLLVPQVASIPESGFHFFSRPRPQSFNDSQLDDSQATASFPRLSAHNTGQPAVSQDLPKTSFTAYTLADQTLSRTSTPVLSSSALSTTSPLFVLKSGMILSIGNYTYRDGRITYTLAAGGGGVISSDEINWTATTRVNSARGVRITLRSGPAAAVTPGL
jgi:hypothetical protein